MLLAIFTIQSQPQGSVDQLGYKLTLWHALFKDSEQSIGTAPVVSCVRITQIVNTVVLCYEFPHVD